MELKETIQKVHELRSHIANKIILSLSGNERNEFREYFFAIDTLLFFCESVLKLQESGMPKKKELNNLSYYEDDEGNEDRELREHDLGFNACHDEMTAWIVSRVNVKRIRKVIDYYNSEEVDGSKMTWEEYRNQFASAIVKDILEGKE